MTVVILNNKSFVIGKSIQNMTLFNIHNLLKMLTFLIWGFNLNLKPSLAAGRKCLNALKFCHWQASIITDKNNILANELTKISFK